MDQNKIVDIIEPNECSKVLRQEILDQLPQTGSFRFIDEIVELSTEHIKARYLFKGNEWFYEGHFRNEPVTPGVIMIETMAQAGLVALGIYLLKQEGNQKKMRTLFTECNVEFLKIIRPKQLVTVFARKCSWRRNKLLSKAELFLEDGTLAAAGMLSGMGVEV